MVRQPIGVARFRRKIIETSVSDQSSIYIFGIAQGGLGPHLLIGGRLIRLRLP